MVYHFWVIRRKKVCIFFYFRSDPEQDPDSDPEQDPDSDPYQKETDPQHWFPVCNDESLESLN